MLDYVMACKMSAMCSEDGHRRRIRHYDVPGHAHYLTFSCFHNQPFLKSERTCGWLIEAILAAKRETPFDLWAWVAMPSHVHLLIRPIGLVRVGDILKAVKEPMSKRATYWVRKNAPGFVRRMEDVQPGGRRTLRFWQPGGGYDRNIVSVAEVREKIGYIHGNPVRAGLVASPEEWRWSSWRAWQSGVDEPLPIDRGTVPPL